MMPVWIVDILSLTFQSMNIVCLTRVRLMKPDILSIAHTKTLGSIESNTVHQGNGEFKKKKTRLTSAMQWKFK